MADLRFEHATKRYGTQPPVITDLNLRILDHEFMVLVGPSGCGKSTALRMIAGLEEITEGDLYIGDRRVNDVPAKDRDIAMVFQSYALYPHMTVRQNMAFSLRMRGVARAEIETRVRKAAETLGLSDYLERKPRELSGGQRQRVALGRALVREPQVFLLDEPLSNLDAKLRVQMRAEIARLHQTTGTSFVYVTHDQVEAMTMGDRIAVLNAGVIQQLGTPQQLYDAPANLFVAGFIGSPAMNFLTGRLSSQSEADEISVVLPEVGTVSLGDMPARSLAGVATPGEGREVIAGVRPEHLRLAAEGEPGTLSGVVQVVEHLGNEQLVYLGIPAGLKAEVVARDLAKEESGELGPNVVVRCDAETRLNVGSRLSLRLDADHLHVFDPQTRLNLARHD